MRVAMLTNNRFPPGEGIGQHVKALSERLIKRGHEVQIVVRGTSRQHWSAWDYDGLPVREYPYLPIKPFHHQATAKTLNAWLERDRSRFDLLHVHLPLFPPLQTDLPIIATIHSPMLTDNAAIIETGIRPWAMKANAKCFSRAYEQWYLERSHALIAVSVGVKAELEAHYRLAGRRAHVLGNAVDAEFFRPPSNHPRGDHILFVGRLSYRKGLNRLIEAFARMPHVAGRKLEIIGTGPLEATIRRLSESLQIAERVIFRGFQDRANVREALQRAALFVNPADYETGPLTVLEAMACGTPVISTKTGLVAEMGAARGADAPLWLAPQDAPGLAAILEQAWQERHDTDKPQRALAMVRNSYAWDSRVDRLEALYTRILEWKR